MGSTDDPPGLIDTDILIDAARDFQAVAGFLSSQRKWGPLHVSVVTAMELVTGCRNKKELQHVQQFLSSVMVLPITEAVSSAARGLVESYWLSHGLLLPDAFIAATSVENQFTLYTKNVRHFNMIPGLSLMRPY